MTAAVVSQTAFISHSQLMISAIRHRLWDVYSSLWSLPVCVKEVKSSCVTPFLRSCIGGRHQIKLSEVQWLWKTAPHDSQLDISCQSWNTLNFALPPFFFFATERKSAFFFWVSTSQDCTCETEFSLNAESVLFLDLSVDSIHFLAGPTWNTLNNNTFVLQVNFCNHANQQLQH